MKIRWIAAAAAFAAAAASGSAATAAPFPGPPGSAEGSSLRCDRPIRAALLQAQLARGGRFLCAAATVRGDIELSQIGAVRGVFACTGCTFAGRLDARHVVFEREI